mgnify:CR=1 FL=1
MKYPTKLLAAACCLASQALADPTRLEEVVVTAELRPAPLLSQVGSISVISAQDILEREARGCTTAEVDGVEAPGILSVEVHLGEKAIYVPMLLLSPTCRHREVAVGADPGAAAAEVVGVLAAALGRGRWLLAPEQDVRRAQRLDALEGLVARALADREHADHRRDAVGRLAACVVEARPRWRWMR